MQKGYRKKKDGKTILQRVMESSLVDIILGNSTFSNNIAKLSLKEAEYTTVLKIQPP